MLRRALRRPMGVVLVVLSALGCGGTGAYPVAGVVLLDGEPLEGATVVCHPEANASGQPAIAVTAADGSFKLDTVVGKGALPNSYRVTLTKVTGQVEVERPPWLGRQGQPPTAEEKSAWR